MKKPILIDVSLTGGRGPAKKVYEFVTDLNEQDIPFRILTDAGFAFKLKEAGIKPDYIVNTSLNEKVEDIIKAFAQIVRLIDFCFMVKFGARAAGPIAARKLGKPYFIVDGGLPDCLSSKEDLYEKRTFAQAEAYFITTQFNWKPPNRIDLQNIKVSAYPLSRKTFKWLGTLCILPKVELIKQVEKNITNADFLRKDNLFINLVITGDYFRRSNRVTYGGWLSTQQYDQCVGFVRRLVTDIGENFKQNVGIFLDLEIVPLVADILQRYKNLRLVTYKNRWSLKAEIILQAAADITISRATNYQPYIAALLKGNSITTPVPANGYMDEDSAALQYKQAGLTEVISYDDEQYVFKLIRFLKNTKQQSLIKQKLHQNLTFMSDQNLNEILIKIYKNFERNTYERNNFD